MRHRRKTALPLAAAVIAVAYALRMLIKLWDAPAVLGIPRALLYILLFTAWTLHAEHAVQQRPTQRCMVLAGALTVLWCMIRTVKYELVTDPAAGRLLWYCYYLPMLFIPMTALTMALSIGKPEARMLSRRTAVLWAVTAGLFLLVLTNDLHGLVFRFPEGLPPALRSDRDYSYCPLYYAVVVWMVLCGTAALIVLAVKCRVPHSRRYLWMPLIPLLLSMAYFLLYWLGVPFLRLCFGDLPTVQSLLFLAALESCIRCGLVPSNSDYDALFRTVTVGMQITDRDYCVRYASDAALPLDRADIRRAVAGGGAYDKTTLLRAQPISGGYAVWSEDLSKMIRKQEALSAVCEELQERNELLRDQYRRDAQRYRIEEQNRLFDLVQSETQTQLRRIDALTERLIRQRPPEEERRALLLRLLVIATYVKRHKDMVILAERSEALPLHALTSALRESCSNLPLGGIEYNLYAARVQENLPVQAALSAYACFEEVLEAALDTLTYLLVSLAKKQGEPCLSLTLECACDPSGALAAHGGAAVEPNGDGWVVTVPLTGGETL